MRLRTYDAFTDEHASSAASAFAGRPTRARSTGIDARYRWTPARPRVRYQRRAPAAAATTRTPTSCRHATALTAADWFRTPAAAAHAYRYGKWTRLSAFGGSPFFAASSSSCSSRRLRAIRARSERRWRSAGSARATCSRSTSRTRSLTVFLHRSSATSTSRRRGAGAGARRAARGSDARVAPRRQLHLHRCQVPRRRVDGVARDAATTCRSCRATSRIARLSWAITGRRGCQRAARYVGEQYMDNDETNTFYAKIPSYTIVDLKLHPRAGRLAFRGRVNNLLDEKLLQRTHRSTADSTRTVSAVGGTRCRRSRAARDFASRHRRGLVRSIARNVAPESPAYRCNPGGHWSP